MPASAAPSFTPAAEISTARGAPDEVAYQVVSVTHITPSPTNPRRHAVNHAVNFKAWALDDLAENIRQHGVIEPVLLRPNPASDHAFDGRPDFELVAGERRWRASQLAGRETIPALVRTLTDLQVLELQLAENIHAQALHPIEEAEHFDRLLRADGGPGSADELAARIGKSASLVRNRLDLLKLCAPVREACLAGEVGASVALEIANGTPPGDDAAQQRALKEAVAGWGGEPFSARSMRAHMRKHYMLRLDHARFDPEASYHDEPGGCGYVLIGPKPDGKCSSCPKRTSANADFFTDVKEGDMCQDAACYHAKTAAARTLLIETARAEGATVIEGSEATRLARACPKPDGYQLLDHPCIAFTDHPRTLRQAAGDALASADLIFVDAPELETPRIMVTDATAQRALKSRGLLKITAPAVPATAPRKPPPSDPRAAKNTIDGPPPKASGGSNAGGKPEVEDGADITDPLYDAALDFKVIPEHAPRTKSLANDSVKHWTQIAEAKARALLCARAILRRCRSGQAPAVPAALARLVLTSLIYADSYVTIELAAQMADVSEINVQAGYAYPKFVLPWISTLDDDELARMMLVYLALQNCEPLSSGVDFAGETARFVGIALAPIVATATALVRERVQLELMQRGKPAKPAPAGARKTAAPKPPPKYRNADTGETWSGRGLQPKWLKVALERGHQLADFAVGASTPAAPACRGVTPKKAKATRGERATIEVKGGGTISAVAAWPFPKEQP